MGSQLRFGATGRATGIMPARMFSPVIVPMLWTNLFAESRCHGGLGGLVPRTNLFVRARSSPSGGLGGTGYCQCESRLIPDKLVCWVLVPRLGGTGYCQCESSVTIGVLH